MRPGAVCLAERPARGVRMIPAGMVPYSAITAASAKPLPPTSPVRRIFPSVVVRAGISPPALIKLMGHAHISITIVYVQISPRDVFEQYARAVAQQIRPSFGFDR
jgi:hypothetical protein